VSDVALELVTFAGLKPAQVRADRVTLRCPFHDDHRPSAAVLASGVMTCAAGCGSRSPYAWLVALGFTPADVMELLVRLELRADRDDPARSPSCLPDRATKRRERRRAATAVPAIRPDSPAATSARSIAPELPLELRTRLDAAIAARPRFDSRLGELRGFTTEALEAAGVGIGRARDFGFRGPRAALEELRLIVPTRDRDRRLVGLLAVAPNPSRRAEPKLLALAGTPRLPLELLSIASPIAPVLIVTEGELDAIAAASSGLPAIGVPGVGGFARHAARIAELVHEHGLEHALLVPDADDPGRRAFRELAEAIANAGAPTIYADVLEDGSDVGSYLVAIAAELARSRPEIASEDRPRAAGRSLLDLIAHNAAREAASLRQEERRP
jgi:hypothetical protein